MWGIARTFHGLRGRPRRGYHAPVLSLADAEGESLLVYERACAAPDEPPGPHALAEALGLTIEHGGRGIVGDAMLLGDVIRVRRRLPTPRETFAVAHELAEWWLRGRYDEQAEQSANLLAACILMPRPAVARAVEVLGRDLAALAEAFAVTETAVALRLAEIDDTPTLIVSRSWAWVRGAPFGWPTSVEGARRLAKCTPPEGLELERLRDDPRRVVIRGRG